MGRSDMQLPRAFGSVPLYGVIRRKPADFVVRECLPFEPSGQGEHYYLLVRKSQLTTEAVQKRIAREMNLKNVAVSYAGLKDKQGVCDQWFSVHMPGKAVVDWARLNSADLQVLHASRHDKKLRRGVLRENRFILRLREVSGDFAQAWRRLRQIETLGVPNYFGEQRFGVSGNNVQSAAAMFLGQIKVQKPYLRGIYLSAARSQIFNHVLARRIQLGRWRYPVQGDVFMLDGTHSVFHEQADAAIHRRLCEMDIHITGPLWGAGASMASGVCAALEQTCVDDYPVLKQGLLECGMEAQRRALRVRVKDLTMQRMHNDDCILSFSLPAGAYATAVLRELIHYEV